MGFGLAAGSDKRYWSDEIMTLHVEYKKEFRQKTHRSCGSKLVFGLYPTADTVQCRLLATED